MVVNIKSTRGDEGEVDNATQSFGVRPQRDRVADGGQIFSTVKSADPSAVDAHYDGLHTHSGPFMSAFCESSDIGMRGVQRVVCVRC